MQPEIRFFRDLRMGKRTSAGQPWVRCPALVLCGLRNRGGRDQLGAHQQHEGVQGVSPGTLPCLQGIVCYTCRPQGYGNGGRKVGQSALYHRLGKGTGAGRYTKSGQTAYSMARNLLGRYCQPSLSGPSSEGKHNFATKGGQRISILSIWGTNCLEVTAFS